jgi:uncharacterized protein HemX
MPLHFDIGDFVALLGVAGGAIGVWVALNGRVVKLETQLQAHKERMDATSGSVDRRFKEHEDRAEKQYDKIMDTLVRIEEKLDGKADKRKSTT